MIIISEMVDYFIHLHSEIELRKMREVERALEWISSGSLAVLYALVAPA